ncbi:hypothetical protein BT96DRAFT_1005965 [Gymnopus androsaceus JB14]|uniref:F-box domain-containing protein n=1 Tax=Gymnopus androsaceus JB14 TaxID=1447944 RepID=A0A6A4GMS4_9AGAR|nr:hypothetical protein BT96DRAFT_1005965 [Gymnopus androsaceus JB14]
MLFDPSPLLAHMGLRGPSKISWNPHATPRWKGWSSISVRVRRCNVPAVVGPRVEDMAWPQHTVISFILRSTCSLTFLQLGDPFISTHDLLTLLLHTPALSHLDFYQNHRLEPTEEQLADDPVLAPSLTMSWIKRLHAYGTEGSHECNNALLPKLTNLFLTVLGSWFDDDQLFVDVILSRWVPDPSLASDIGITCLKAVKLKVWGRSLDDKVYERVVQLGKAGMKVELSSEIPPR